MERWREEEARGKVNSCVLGICKLDMLLKISSGNVEDVIDYMSLELGGGIQPQMPIRVSVYRWHSQKQDCMPFLKE